MIIFWIISAIGWFLLYVVLPISVVIFLTNWVIDKISQSFKYLDSSGTNKIERTYDYIPKEKEKNSFDEQKFL